ncbi:MAG: polysaccharide biosynthesis C-terminal domain-containing protein [Nanoarchaeota archaeon]|nr:polysaccharide biosynthesis C-terminal domain-containing protein [Nanoarchaeota archaeon]
MKAEYNGEGRKETLYFFVLNFFSKSITYFVLLVLANLFSLEVYGKATYAISIFSLSILVLFVGIPETFISWYVKKRNVTSVAYFLVFLSLFSVIFGLVFFWDFRWLYPLLFLLPFFLVKMMGDSFFRIHHKQHFVQVFGILTMALYLAFLILFKDMGETGIILAYSLAYFIVSIIVFLLLFGDFSRLFKGFKFNFVEIGRYLQKGYITAIVSVSFAILTWIDSSLLGLLSTYENVAKYNVSGSISAIIAIVPVAIGIFLLTRSAEIKDNNLTRSLLKRSIRLTVSISLFFSIIMISLISIVIKYLFSQYMGIEKFIVILSFGLIFAGVNHIIAMYYIGKLQPGFVLFPVLFAAILNIILDIFLIPLYGLYGITVATTVAHFSAMFIFLFKVKLLNYFIPVLIVSTLVILSFLLGYFGVLMILPLVVLLFYLGLINRNDINVMIQVARKIFK